MGKQADFQPRWLVSLMCQWARRTSDEEGAALGYPKQAAFLTIGRAKVASTDPTEFCARDYRDLEAALRDCWKCETKLWAAMMMYYRPWCIEAFKAEGWPFGNSTYYDRLHAAHRRIAEFLDNLKAKPLAELAIPE